MGAGKGALPVFTLGSQFQPCLGGTCHRRKDTLFHSYIVIECTPASPGQLVRPRELGPAPGVPDQQVLGRSGPGICILPSF